MQFLRLKLTVSHFETHKASLDIDFCTSVRICKITHFTDLNTSNTSAFVMEKS